MRIYADHLTILLYIRDNVVDRNLCCGTCCRRHCKDRHTLMLCIGNALQAAHIGKIRILHNDTNALGGIHRRSTTDRDNVISACSLASRNTCLYILDRWVWLDIGIQLISKSCAFKHIQNLLCHTELYKIRIRTYKCFLESTSLCLVCDALDRSCSMIRCLVQYKSVYHNNTLPFLLDCVSRYSSSYGMYLPSYSSIPLIHIIIVNFHKKWKSFSEFSQNLHIFYTCFRKA